MNVSECLILWYFKNKRTLPWRDIESPYKIWISEIMLQQTRVDQTKEYYNHFIERFPEIKDLALARIEEVLKLWQGLGYYSRARYLHITANTIYKEYNGVFPDKYEKLIKLKGIGPYTAAAIASIAFNEPVAVVDGNVYRFLARYYGIDSSMNSYSGIKKFAELANNILNKNSPGIHNQAIMEFGSLQCIPKNPDCNSCIFKNSCYAFGVNSVERFPLKKVKTKQRERYFNYLYIHYKDYTFLNQRNENDIWRLLFEFPLIETDRKFSIDELIVSSRWKELFNNSQTVEIKNISKTYVHKLSHQKIFASFYKIKINVLPKNLPGNFKLIKKKNIGNYAISRLMDKYLENKDIK